MPWTLAYERKAIRSIRDKTELKRLDRALVGLTENPRPSGATKLAGHDDLWRIRVGDWRIVYAIEDEKLVILIVAIGQRGDIYEKLGR